MDDATLRRTVDELDSRVRILELGARYARGVDRLDRELLRACFHPDSQHWHGDYKGTSWGFCDEIMKMVGALEHTQHLLGTRSITVDGDHASGELYWIAYHRVGPDGWYAWPWARPHDLVIMGGRYLDRYERRDSGWKISYRRGVHEWDTYIENPPRRTDDLWPDFLGRRNRADPVYLWHQTILDEDGRSDVAL